MTVIEESAPLEQNYLPEKIVDRDKEIELLSDSQDLQNFHIHGPRGTGKTLVVKKALKEFDARTCHVSCLEHDTQYKALRQIISKLSTREIESGHHTSELQRKLEEHTEVMDITIVLDELDFLLLNDGEDLLYFLSRMQNPPKIVVITSNTEKLKSQVEPRTYSSLYPKQVQFEHYTGEQIYEILADRAAKSLENRSLHRNAVTYIASSTQNAEIALTWLRVAAQNAEDTVTEDRVQEIQKEAFQAYTEQRLQKLSQHHKILYQAVMLR